MENTLSAGKQCGQRCLIISNVITIAGDGTIGVAVSVRNNLKTRTSLRPVHITWVESPLKVFTRLDIETLGENYK